MSIQNNFWAPNLKFLRARKKLNQDDLANQLGIKRSKLNAHENGRTKNPPVEDLIKFSGFFRMNIDTLLKVDLASLPELKVRELEAGNDIYVSGRNIRILATTVNPQNKENVELVPVKAKAGYLAGYADPEYIGSLPVFHLPHLDPQRKYRMFPTEGDSMLPVPEGSFVIAEFVQDWNSIKDRVPCIIVATDGISFKMVSHRTQENRTFLLESLNPVHSSYMVDAHDVLEIWKFHSYFTDILPEPSSLEQLTQSVHEIKVNIRKLMTTTNPREE